MKSRAYLLVLFAALFCTSHVVHAQGTVDVYLQVKPRDQTNPKTRGKAPQLEATIVGGPTVPLEKFSISTTKNNQRVSVKAEKLRSYAEGTETIALALVISGQKVWIGNDDYVQDENAKYEGVLKTLAQAIDKLQIGNAAPPGSLGTVITYSMGAVTKVPMGDLKAITGAALGNQKDYEGGFNNSLVQGITMGVAELSKVSTARKVLIVIGDGNDSDGEHAKPQLADLKKLAAKQNIQTFSIIYKSPISDDGAMITTMIPGAKTVSTVDGISSELNAIVARLADRYYVTFTGYDEKLKQGLPWDGKEHDLTIKIDQQELEPVTMTLAPIWNPPVEGGFPWLVVILVVVGLILLIVIGVKVFKKPAEAPAMPMPMPMPVPAPMPGMPMPAPPKPAGPMKTVMIGAGGDQDGFPIVGWIVALNGVDAYRTQRLKPGLTKIGTAPPADIVVNDGFMSTEHCQIQASPSGFVLVDNGSTNGSYVNDRKVQKHELVDNDVITLGKTNFKFKSIN